MIKEKTLKMKMDMLRSNGKQSGQSVELVLEKKKKTNKKKKDEEEGYGRKDRWKGRF